MDTCVKRTCTSRSMAFKAAPGRWNTKRGQRILVQVEKGVISTSASQKVQGHEVVHKYYEAYNVGDFATLETLFSSDCSYHDMIFEDPMEGRGTLLKYFRKVRKLLKDEVKFVVDDITTGDDGKVGATWHVETAAGVKFPFSRGCSFYTLNEQGQITSGKDWVEPALKPGKSALKGITAVLPLVKALGDKADPSALKSLPIAAVAVWGFYAVYTSAIFFSSDLPGTPIWATPPEVLQEIYYESLNFFYINVFLADWGIAPVPSVACPPVSEGIFNAVAAWTMMFLPLMLSDGQSQKVQNKTSWYTAMMLLTNVFFIPYLALRAAPEPPGTPLPPPHSPMPSWSPVLGAVGGVVGVASIFWALTARPEYGDLPVRWQYFQETFSSNRAFFAFIVDSSLYCIWQWDMMRGAPTALRALPYFGLAGWLITGGKREEDEEY